MLAAEVWHWWIGIILSGVGVLAVLGLDRQLPEERHGAPAIRTAASGPTTDRRSRC